MRSPLASIHKSPALPYAGGALGIGIFVFDTLSPLEFASESVFSYNGNIDKFLGDGLTAIFGPPLPGPVDATSAVRCALHILQSAESWNDRCQRSGDVKIRIAALRFSMAARAPRRSVSACVTRAR
jgi:hypothetical protein